MNAEKQVWTSAPKRGRCHKNQDQNLGLTVRHVPSPLDSGMFTESRWPTSVAQPLSFPLLPQRRLQGVLTNIGQIRLTLTSQTLQRSHLLRGGFRRIRCPSIPGCGRRRIGVFNGFWGTTRAEDAQGTHTQSRISPVYLCSKITRPNVNHTRGLS